MQSSSQMSIMSQRYSASFTVFDLKHPPFPSDECWYYVGMMIPLCICRLVIIFGKTLAEISLWLQAYFAFSLSVSVSMKNYHCLAYVTLVLSKIENFLGLSCCQSQPESVNSSKVVSFLCCKPDFLLYLVLMYFYICTFFPFAVGRQVILTSTLYLHPCLSADVFSPAV